MTAVSFIALSMNVKVPIPDLNLAVRYVDTAPRSLNLGVRYM
jgi:hypothetical protein